MIVIFTCLGRMVEQYDVRRTDAYVILTQLEIRGQQKTLNPRLPRIPGTRYNIHQVSVVKNSNSDLFRLRAKTSIFIRQLAVL